MNLQYELTDDGYTAAISNLQLFMDSEVELVKAKHYPTYGKHHVTHVRVTRSDTYVMPNIGSHYINLSGLFIENCGLLKVSKEDFSSLTRLKTLHLTNNSIESLPADLFDLTPQLIDLSLRSNKIKFISKYTLTPLTRLKLADFRCNININEIYDSNATYGITLCTLRTKIFEQCKPLNEQISTVSSYMHTLLQGFLSNFIIKVKGEVFNVHKAVLGANSPVFAAMFNHEMEDNVKNEMTIENFTSQTVKEFLAFVYLREVPKKSFNATDLYAMAQEYQINEFSEQIQWYIAMDVNDKNASQMYKFGALYNDEVIKRTAFRAMEESLNRKLPEILLESDEELLELFDIKDKMDDVLEKIDQNESRRCNAALHKGMVDATLDPYNLFS